MTAPEYDQHPQWKYQQAHKGGGFYGIFLWMAALFSNFPGVGMYFYNPQNDGDHRKKDQKNGNYCNFIHWEKSKMSVRKRYHGHKLRDNRCGRFPHGSSPRWFQGMQSAVG